MEVENQHILEAALREGFNLFVGAGFSALAQDASGNFLPLGSALTQEIAAYFDIQHFQHFSLSQLCTIIEASKRNELREFLLSRFRVQIFDPRYRTLDRLALRWLFTTNIDDLLFKIFDGAPEHYLNDIDSTGPAFQSAAIQLVHLHGCVRHANKPFRFGAAELAAAFGADSDRWRFLTQALQERPTLFWGYGVADAGVLQALSPEAISGRPTKEKWIVLHPSAADEASRSYFKALGFYIAVGDTATTLDYLSTVSPLTHYPTIGDAPTDKLFPRQAIPTLGQVPLRPLQHFFLGAPPEWSDIFSPVIHKTEHFYRIKNEILSKRHIVLIGAPASGKTTLLMQLAAQVSTDSHKIILDSLTYEHAEFIRARLAGERAVVFLDNCSDSMDGMEELARSEQIRVVAAERDYVYGFVSHRVEDLAFTVVDVTSLSGADIQSCIASIPQPLTGQEHYFPAEGPEAIPSLFEIIQRNVHGATLSARFKNVLTSLYKQDKLLHDAFLMLCYVNYCRTPVSMDMFIAFLRPQTSDWEVARSLLKRLANLIADYAGPLVGEEAQDYFAPRSTLVGEAVMSTAHTEALKRVLQQFHSEVSTARICRYDVFRRKGYDADLFVRAFPDWQEGWNFYDSLYRRDPSPFMRQQCALYLSRKNRHAEAFRIIDQAVVESDNRVWSIRNSHAIIMFRANIRHSEDVLAQQSLQASMNTLTECYKWDRRKTFHAVKFAEQATSYWEVFRDRQAQEYLKQAEKWLDDEESRAPWHRAVKYIRRKVKQCISFG